MAPILFQYQSKTEPVQVTTTPEDTTIEAKWHQPWSVPVRVKPGLTAALNPVCVGFTVPEVITEDKWYQAWSTPVRTKPRSVEFRDYTANVFPITTSPEDTTIEAKWHQPWSTPPGAKRGLTAATQPILVTFGVQETITEDKWHQPWSQPVRTRPRTVEFRDYTANVVVTPEDTTLEGKWHQAWSSGVTTTLAE